ncbi:MAG: HEAT repeat protein [Paracoccaceae bacterium]|jgi:HEAT repeat protein
MKIKSAERLSEILKGEVDVHRCAAARALGVIGGPKATSDLVAALLDEDPDVRTDAAMALADIQDPETADKLMENLVGDPESDVKKAAIKALVAMRHQPVVPLLRALAVSRSEDQFAWDEEAFYTDGWDAWDDIQMTSIKALGDFQVEEAVSEILTAMADELGQDVSEPAFCALAKMGHDGAQALGVFYESGDPRLVRRVARAVGQSDNPHLSALLGDMLADKSAAIRALALENLASDDARLVEMFQDPDAVVRAAAVHHHGVAHLPVLRDLIADADPKVRVEVFKIIAAHPETFREKEQVDAVKNTVKGDPTAARHAALALFALKGPVVAKGFMHVLGNAKIPHEFRIGVLETLEKAGETAVPALLEVAADPNRQMRLSSLTTLANIAANDPVWPNDAGVGLLIALKGELVLPPEEPEVEEVEPVIELVPKAEPDQAELEEIAREIDESLPLVAADAAPGSTLRAIMANEPDQPKAPLQEIILDDDQERLLAMTNTRKFSKRKVSWDTEVAPYLDVQRFSARLLGQVVQDEVTEALIASLNSDIDEETRQAVLFSLAEHGDSRGHLPDSLFETAKGLLDSENSEIRVLATRLFGFLPGDAIDELLVALVGHHDQLVRVEAIRSLDRRNVVSDALTGALNDSYLGAGIAAARALARLGGDDGVDALVEFAARNDGIYRRDIGKLLGEYAPHAGAARLLDLLNDEARKNQWLVAIDALAEIFQTQAPEQTPDQTLLVA